MFFFRKRELIAITGAGGKTSLAMVLGSLLSHERRVVITTTTHIGCGELPSSLDHFSGNLKEVFSGLKGIQKDESFLAVVTSGREKGKFSGLTSNDVDSLFKSGLCDLIIVEADGANGFPVKGYKSHEPVIPGLTTCQIVIVGAEIFFKPMDVTTVFRLTQFLSDFRLMEGTILSSPSIALVLESPQGFLKGSPENEDMRRILLINKVDLLRDMPDCQQKVRETFSMLKRYDLAGTAVLRGNECGSADPGCGIIDTNGEGQASSAIWRKNGFIICN